MERRDDIDHAGGVNPLPSRRPKLLLLFPGALGDFICFLPTITGLRAATGAHLVLVAKPALTQLVSLDDTTAISIDRAEIADLFSDAPRLEPRTRALLGGFDGAFSWTGAASLGFAKRLATLGKGQVRVFPFRGMGPGEHAVDYFARCAGVAPGEIRAAIRSDQAWFEQFSAVHRLARRGFAVFHPGSGSPRKNWTGFDDLARLWDDALPQTPIVWLQGPVEDEGERGTGRDRVISGLSLPQVAALLENARFFVGNDSGISHLAGAVGADGLALFGPSDPRTWRPRGSIEALVAGPVCPIHGPEVFCIARLDPNVVFSAVRNRIRAVKE